MDHHFPRQYHCLYQSNTQSLHSWSDHLTSEQVLILRPPSLAGGLLDHPEARFSSEQSQAGSRRIALGCRCIIFKMSRGILDLPSDGPIAL
jgi:hypothetical protein